MGLRLRPKLGLCEYFRGRFTPAGTRKSTHKSSHKTVLKSTQSRVRNSLKSKDL